MSTVDEPGAVPCIRHAGCAHSFETDGPLETRNLQPSRFGQWFILSRGCRNEGRWIAWAKRSPFVTEELIEEPGEVWFWIADTRREALMMLTNELRELDTTWWTRLKHAIFGRTVGAV